MAQRLLFDIEETRFYRDLRDKVEEELTPRIALKLIPKIERELTPRIALELMPKIERALIPKIATELILKIEQELASRITRATKREIVKKLLLRKMNLKFIAEVTRLTPREVRTIMKELASPKRTRVTIQDHENLSAVGKSHRNRRGPARID